MTNTQEQQPELKPEQAVAAHTLDRHVSVTAGPGSGKTTVLVERYLHILRENKNLSIDQIVAITFTNRAANEMRERLRKDLDRIVRTSRGDERQRWMRFKRTLDGAVINTIHGFCARLLREYPVEARIDPQFLLLDQHDAAMLLEASVEETLTEFISSGREGISELALGFGRGKLAEALVQLYRNVRDQGLDLEQLAQRTEAGHSTADAYVKALEDLDATMHDLINCGRLTAAAETKRSYARANWPKLRQILMAEPLSLAEYCSAIEAFRAAARPQKNAIGVLVERLDEQLWGADKKGPLGLVPQIRFDLRAKHFALEMISVVREIERRYREKKQVLSALDFDDLQTRALAVLDQPAVRRRALERYRYFLVDEFQDTNAVQRDLMHKLALSVTRANLFIVGDRKQSIYGFRGADVDVFQQTTRALKDAGGIEQPLNLNFRSQPSLIRFFNRLFSRLFESVEDVATDELSELGFVGFEESREQRPHEDQQPLVELLIDTQSPAEDDPRAQRAQADRDAKQVARRIESLVHGDAGRRYSDIALLFRAMTDVRVYESVLRTAGIPFQTVQGKGFYEREEVSDLIQLLRFLDNKTDELALATVLRSPLAGISDNALLALRCAPWLNEAGEEKAMRHFNQPRKLYYALRRHREIAYITEEEHVLLAQALDLLRRLIERRNHYAIADLLRLAVQESEYTTVVAANFDGGQRLANIQKLFTLAGRFEHAGAHLVRDFVRYVEEFEAIGSREGEGQIDDAADAVKLMTIHQAKGLEFPVVIIPNLHHRSRNPQEYWYALDRHRGLTVKVPDGRGKQVIGSTFDTFRQRARLREHFESVRLLYVAATRARDRLILSGATDELGKLNGSPDNWLKLIWQKLDLKVTTSTIVELEGETQLAIKLNLADEPLVAASVRAKSEPIPDLEEAESITEGFPLIKPLAADLAVGPHRISVTQLTNYRRCPRQYFFDRVLAVPGRDALESWNDAEAPEPPANLTATLKGAVIHRFCETYTKDDDVEKILRQSFAEVVRRRQAELADRLVDIDVEAGISELLPLASNYLSSEVFGRVEFARSNCSTPAATSGGYPSSPRGECGLWSELSFRLKRPFGILTGAIDKLLITPAADGKTLNVEIIDFKTNRFRPLLNVEQDRNQPGKPNGPKVSSHSRRTQGTFKNQIAFDFERALSESAPGNVDLSSEAVQRNVKIAEQVRVAASDYQLQMQAYALAVGELMPELIEPGHNIRVTLHFLEPDIEFRLPDNLLRRDVCESAIDNAMREIVSASEPEQFPVRPAIHCRMCNFLNICAAGREWLRSSTASFSRVRSAAEAAR